MRCELDLMDNIFFFMSKLVFFGYYFYVRVLGLFFFIKDERELWIVSVYKMYFFVMKGYFILLTNVLL